MAAHYMVLAIVRSMDLLAAQSLGLQRFSNAKSLDVFGGSWWLTCNSKNEELHFHAFLKVAFPGAMLIRRR